MGYRPSVDRFNDWPLFWIKKVVPLAIKDRVDDPTIWVDSKVNVLDALEVESKYIKR